MIDINNLTEGDKIRLGNELRLMLNSEAFGMAEAMLKQSYTAVFMNTERHQKQEREDAHLKYTVLNEIIGAMRTVIQVADNIQDANRAKETYNNDY